MLDEGTQAHLAAIDRALTLDEAAELRKRFAALSPRERASWVATLVMLPVTDAVAAIRAQLAAADASVAAPSPANVSIGSVPLAAPIVATTPAPSAAASRGEAMVAQAHEVR
jgi:hypothetical protein